MNKQDGGFIYTQYRDKVFGFVRSKIVNQTEAEDIVQTVFLKVYSNLDKYDETKASLSTWIYTITRNTVYDYLKAKRDRPVFELLDNREAAAESARYYHSYLLSRKTQNRSCKNSRYYLRTAALSTRQGSQSTERDALASFIIKLKKFC